MFLSLAQWDLKDLRGYLDLKDLQEKTGFKAPKAREVHLVKMV
jgi:hypothetical protein